MIQRAEAKKGVQINLNALFAGGRLHVLLCVGATLLVSSSRSRACLICG
jgi:hypothetical protein